MDLHRRSNIARVPGQMSEVIEHFKKQPKIIELRIMGIIQKTLMMILLQENLV